MLSCCATPPAGRAHPEPVNPDQIAQAVNRVDSLDILINNAGVSVPDDLGDRSAFERHLVVNLYGTLDVTQAFLPALRRSQGAVVNVVSIGCSSFEGTRGAG